jgi:hypothetical protein
MACPISISRESIALRDRQRVQQWEELRPAAQRAPVTTVSASVSEDQDIL